MHEHVIGLTLSLAMRTGNFGMKASTHGLEYCMMSSISLFGQLIIDRVDQTDHELIGVMLPISDELYDLNGTGCKL